MIEQYKEADQLVMDASLQPLLEFLLQGTAAHQLQHPQPWYHWLGDTQLPLLLILALLGEGTPHFHHHFLLVGQDQALLQNDLQSEKMVENLVAKKLLLLQL
jgi:hypothetical protein